VLSDTLLGNDDPNLEQTIDSAEQVAEGTQVLDIGHVDLGPKFVSGQWRFMVHDDAAKADSAQASVWRHPDQTVLHVSDQAILPVPDDPAYQFVGAEANQEVWVIPQTQNPEVVWLGWNTQDPEVMESIDRGVTLSLTGAHGPGVVTAFLQSGSFGEPEVLFDSRVAGDQEVWVDVNTHTHANWVFTEPGVYLLRLRVNANLIDGSTVSDSQVFRFAVGTATAPEEALAAVWPEPDTASKADSNPTDSDQGEVGDSTPAPGGEADDNPGQAAGSTDQPSSDSGVSRTLLLCGLGLAVALGAVAAASLIRSRRAKDQVFTAGGIR
jgi:putative ABC transporter-associated repeat protein